MDMITISAKTLDEAITNALIKLSITSEHLHYEVIEKGSPGLLGMFSKPCVIRVGVKEEIKVEIKPEAKPEVKPEIVKEPIAKDPIKKVAQVGEKVKKEISFSSEVQESSQLSAKKFLKDMFVSMNIEVEIETSFNEKDGELSIILTGSDMGILIGKRGQTLDSLQYLVSLVVNKETQGYIRVKLDTENYRARRKETLENLAKNISYKVKRTKHAVSLEPMNPYERRIIHSVLQGDKYVVTRSEGEDPYRHVVISLRRERNYSRSKSKKKEEA